MSLTAGDEDSGVRVAVRIRLQIAQKLIDKCQICTTVTPGVPQVTLLSDKAFTYDCVFDTNAQQKDVYSTCVEALVNESLEGYNATVLAYGQGRRMIGEDGVETVDAVSSINTHLLAENAMGGLIHEGGESANRDDSGQLQRDRKTLCKTSGITSHVPTAPKDIITDTSTRLT